MILKTAVLTVATLLSSGILRPVFGQTVTEFLDGFSPAGITAGPDGALWYTDSFGNAIGRISITGVKTSFELPSADSNPQEITRGLDGALWFTEHLGNRIGRITTAGVITEFATPSPGRPLGIVTGPDGALWFTEYNLGLIGRITTDGSITEFPVPLSNGISTGPRGITAGPDGFLWFTESTNTANKIARISTTGSLTEFALPTPDSAPSGIAAGSDGAIWFTEQGVAFPPTARWRIGRITTAGVITEFDVQEQPGTIASGPDGALWFTQPAVNRIGRFATAGALNFVDTPTGRVPAGVTSGPDGNVWFTSAGDGKIGRINLVAGPSEIPTLSDSMLALLALVLGVVGAALVLRP